MSLRHRINRLAQRRRGARMRIVPAGEQNGMAMEAHISEHAAGCLVVAAPLDADTWAAMAQAQQARLLARCQEQRTDDAE